MRVNSIQFLRAVAALLVVYEHSMDVQIRFGSSWQQNFYYLNNFGCIGVDLFFVISGFIITYVANEHRGLYEGINFLQKRFYRINPVYYIATTLFLLVYLFKLYIYHIPFTIYKEKTILSILDSLIIIPSSKNIQTFSPLLIVGWTLCFEWLFYFTFFFLILFNVKRKTFYLPCLILLLFSIGQIFHPEDLRLQVITNPIMLEFVLGMIICRSYLSSAKTPTWIGPLLLMLGLISYMLLIRFGYGKAWYYLSTITGESSFYKFFWWGIPSGFIVAGCVFLEKNGQLTKLFKHPVALLLGEASYSIYLIHYIVFSILTVIYIKTNFFWQGDIMIWLQLVIATAISLGFYKLIENPFLKYITSKNKTIKSPYSNNES